MQLAWLCGGGEEEGGLDRLAGLQGNVVLGLGSGRGECVYSGVLLFQNLKGVVSMSCCLELCNIF